MLVATIPEVGSPKTVALQTCFFRLFSSWMTGYVCLDMVIDAAIHGGRYTWEMTFKQLKPVDFSTSFY